MWSIIFPRKSAPIGATLASYAPHPPAAGNDPACATTFFSLYQSRLPLAFASTLSPLQVALQRRLDESTDRHSRFIVQRLQAAVDGFTDVDGRHVLVGQCFKSPFYAASDFAALFFFIPGHGNSGSSSSERNRNDPLDPAWASP